MKQHSLVRLNLTPRQVKLLAKKEAVIIKPDQVNDNGEHELKLSVVKQKKLLRNMDKQKGYRLRLDETEGGSFLQHYGLSLAKSKKPNVVTSNAREATRRPERPKIIHSGLPVVPTKELTMATTGGGISLPLTKENLIKASDPITNVGGVYFDNNRFIRPNQPPFRPAVHTAILQTGSWV